MKLEISNDPSFMPSPFGLTKERASEVDSKGNKVDLPPGITIPDAARLMYNVTNVVPTPYGINFAFLSRDSVEKRYDPGKADPFIFRDFAGVELFKKLALTHLTFLLKWWVERGYPIKRDKDRKIDVPDSELFTDQVLKGQIKLTEFERQQAAICLTNFDIGKKACLARTVTPAWWVVSYAGRFSGAAPIFEPMIRLFVKVMSQIRQTPMFKQKYKETLDSQGDPLDTSIGWPLFSGTTDKDGRPLDKIKVLTKYAGIGTAGWKFSEVKKQMSLRGTNAIERDYVFAMANIRRIQPGYKLMLDWQPSSTGYRLRGAKRGLATNRVAWAAPYVLNLYLSPIQTEWKTFRKCIPGLFLDGDAKKKVLKNIKDDKSVLIESDFSNYDRNIPTDIIDALFREYSKITAHPEFVNDLLRQTVHGLPIIWPDHGNSPRGTGWIFNVEKIALLSGIKITSEIGTFVNLLINLVGWVVTGYKTMAEVEAYLLSKVKNPDGYRSEMEIQSDDLILIGKDNAQVAKLALAFERGCKLSGFKYEIFLGDRYLMRHMNNGADSPVALRVFQNTISNEDNVTDPIKFATALAIRTDGLLGVKTFDPFGTGRIRPVARLEVELTVLMLENTLNIISKASIPVQAAIETVTVLRDMGRRMLAQTSDFIKADEQDANKIDVIRKAMLQLLAKQEALALSKSDTAASWIAALRKDAHSPASALLLEQLLESSDKIKALEQLLTGKEHAFYLVAMRKLGLPLSYNI